MNVLFLYPEFPDTFWSFKHALRFIHKKASTLPLGLLTVAAMLPQEWGKRLVDLNIRRLTARDLAWANMAFVSAMAIQRSSVRQVIDRCKAAGLIVVAGGPLFTAEPESFPDVDHLVLNEAEITLQPFLHDLAAGCARHIYTSHEFPDIRQTPTPLWELADRRRYASMAIQYSRGCPFDCEFCNITSLYGRTPRVKTSAQIIRELDGLYTLGWREPVFFVDDNLVGNKKQLREDLLPALIEWRKGKSGMPFNTEISINIADDEPLMKQMTEAGFDTVFIGIETPESASLVECNKQQNLHRDLIADIRRIQRAGLQVQGGFIVGFDHDTPRTFQNLAHFIQKAGIVTAMVGLLQAPNGTRLYQRMQRAGRLDGSFTGDNVDGATNIIPRMNIDLLKRGYRALVRTLYAPRNYYDRIRTFLRNYKPPRFTTPLKGEYVRAFLRSIVRLGILGRERLQYWKLVLWTLFSRPRLFPQAITLSIYGYHFRRVMDRHVR